MPKKTTHLENFKRKSQHDLEFYLNGEPVVLKEPDPHMLLVDFLRSPSVGLTGTKIGCREGGCGTCTVMLSRFDAAKQSTVHEAVHACHKFVCALAGTSITTTEGLGSVRTELNSIQSQIASNHGTQCGYCTPGFVMSMHSLLCGPKNCTAQAIEDNFDGNLCRCTGYRPILHAMRAFANRKPKDLKRPKLDRRDVKPLWFESGSRQWFRPVNLEDVYVLRENYPDARLVAGNSSTGIYKDPPPPVIIHLGGIEEISIRAVVRKRRGILIGGAVHLSGLMEFLEDVIDAEPPKNTAGLRALLEHLRSVANIQVRNVATIAGNLMLTRTHAKTDRPFPSDLFTVLSALDARVTVGSHRSRPKEIPLETFATCTLPENYLVHSIFIPFSETGEYVRSYKVARRHQNSHAIVNAAFRMTLDSDHRIVRGSVRLVYGGLASTPLRPTGAEQWLAGKTLDETTLKGALAKLEQELAKVKIAYTNEGIQPEYHRSLTQTLFYKFFVSVLSEVNRSIVPPDVAAAGQEFERPLSTGQQSFTIYPDETPVSEPIPKLTAFIQASGEALYTQDVPVSAKTLDAALVFSARAHAKFSHRAALPRLKAKLKQQFPGFVDYVTAEDVPANGTNLIGVGGDDPVFASGEVTCCGQVIGIVVASSYQEAQAAAQSIMSDCIKYDDKPAVLSIEAAIAKNQIFKDNPPTAPFLSHIAVIQRPGSNEAWLKNPSRVEPGCRVFSGSQSASDQAHFYMEPQCALAIPGEDHRMTVYSATQDPDTVQQSVSQVLGIPIGNISILVKLVGGGFGGKTTRVPFVSVPAALAAQKLNRPVRLMLDRNTDMRVIGKRHPYLGKYHIMCSNDGAIRGMKVKMWAGGGNTYDCSFFVTDESQLNGDGAYMIPTYRTEADTCRTNKPSNNAMRSFGVIQATLIREEAIEHAAHELGMLPEDLREKNLYRAATADRWDTTPYGEKLRYCPIAAIWHDLKKSSDFVMRHKAVMEFNQSNRWRKRGLSLIPLKYGVSYARRLLNQARSIVNVYRDGSTVVLHGGVEMGQGIHTKMAQIAADALNVPLEKIKIGDTNTRSLGNATSTGASTGSDLNGGAVLKACRKLKRRLEEFCETIRLSKGDRFCREQGIALWSSKAGWRATVKVGGKETLMWDNVVTQAWMNRIDLTSEAFYNTPQLVDVNARGLGHPYFYFTYGAAVSEVEIDVLSGDCNVLRADVVYDAGRSLNPALDVGQVEGAFVQGIGYLTTEQLIYSSGGELLSDGTWEYKPPCSKTIPIDFRVTLLREHRVSQQPDEVLDKEITGQSTPAGTLINPAAVLSSRSTGEPPFVLSSSVFFAIKHAIQAARRDRGLNSWFPLENPATVERIQLACEVRREDLNLSRVAAAAAAHS